MASTSLPTKPHPIASAFFSSHDEEVRSNLTKKNNGNAGHLSDCQKSPNNFHLRTPSSNGMVTKIRNSLGWRTRYSSSTWHPVSIIPVPERCNERNDGSTKQYLQHDRLEISSPSPATFHVRQVFPGKNNKPKTTSATNEEIASAESDCELGTGASVWPGGMVLLKYLEKLAGQEIDEHEHSVLVHQPECCNILQGKTVADLGSGTAITTIAAALLGAKFVVCTDGCDPVVELARQNVHNAMVELSDQKVPNDDLGDMNNKANKFDVRGCEIIVRKYLWGDGTLLREIPENKHNKLPVSDSESRTEEANDIKYFDVIICADCIVPKLYPIEPLVDALDELSGSKTICYLSYERRHFEKYDPALEFRRLADLRNLVVEVISEEELHPMYLANDIEVWKVTRRRNYSCDAEKEQTLRRQVWRNIHSDSNNNHASLLVGKTKD